MFYTVLLTCLLALSVFGIVLIFIQPQKANGVNVFSTTNSDALFERKKASGFETLVNRLTFIVLGLWMIVALILVILSSY